MKEKNEKSVFLQKNLKEYVKPQVKVCPMAETSAPLMSSISGNGSGWEDDGDEDIDVNDGKENFLEEVFSKCKLRVMGWE